jgi:formylglycine-generating enzyme required for sulfatase activity
MLEKDDKIGEYRLEKFLGRGQFGEVWLAEKQLQVSTRKVRHALKFLFSTGDEIDIKSAEAEIDTWIEASGHPNVMSVLDMLTHRGNIIIVSEFAAGGSLKDWLRQNGGKAPSEEKALEMMRGILRGIEHLHSRNVIHRDLKPDNILLQGDFPRITDFGISRIVSSGSMSTKAMGSPAYMSPESFSGNKSPQTDIWSAGVILYEMLSGEHPFTNDSIYGLVATILETEPKPLPETVSPELAKIAERALQKKSEDRFQTAREMLTAVERAGYELKVKAERDKEFKKTLKVDKKDLPPKQSEIKTLHLKPEPAQTQPAQTQPVKAEKTSDKQIEETRDWREVERERVQREQAELAKIGRRLEQNQQGGNKNKKMLLTVGGAFLCVLLIGGLFWAMSGNTSVSTLPNNTKQGNSSNNSVKTNIPNASDGMVYVPGGEFMMGRDDAKTDAEKPAHKVSVAPFFMDIYETTNEQYSAFVKATNHRSPMDWKNGTYPNGQAKFPVVGVNWDDANDFAKWANKRLPSEQEWEFAARGTNNFIYPWGNDWKDGNANVGSQAFTEVGKFKGASPFGIYDMVGNAWEWTSSDFKAYPGGKASEGANLKTIRGGSFESTKEFATTTYRLGWAATGANTYSRTGFRCVQDVK